LEPVNVRIEIPAEEAKDKRRWRVIYLSPKAEGIIYRLRQKHPTGKLFRNVDGNEWRVCAVNCRFGRLKAKLGTRFAADDLRRGGPQPSETARYRPAPSPRRPRTQATLLG
jgi:hypothetical protein